MSNFLEGVGTLRAEYGASLSALNCRAAQTARRSRNTGNRDAEADSNRNQPAKGNADQRASSPANKTTCQAGTVPLMPAMPPTPSGRERGHRAPP